MMKKYNITTVYMYALDASRIDFKASCAVNCGQLVSLIIIKPNHKPAMVTTNISNFAHSLELI